EFNAGLKDADVQLAPFKALVAGWLMSSGGGQDSGERGASEPSRDEPIEFVTVVVTGMLDDDAQDALRAKLNALADDRDRVESECNFSWPCDASRPVHPIRGDQFSSNRCPPPARLFRSSIFHLPCWHRGDQFSSNRCPPPARHPPSSIFHPPSTLTAPAGLR